MEAMDAPRAAQAPACAPLHICPDCRHERVYPVSWSRREEERWQIERRCPDCEWVGRDEHPLGAVEAYDEILNDSTEALLTSLRNLTRANMEEAVEALVAAIHADGIQPMDF